MIRKASELKVGDEFSYRLNGERMVTATIKTIGESNDFEGEPRVFVAFTIPGTIIDHEMYLYQDTPLDVTKEAAR